jgi:hypothetical protein
VISDDLIAAITDPQRTTIPNNLSIKAQTPPKTQFHIDFKNHVTSHSPLETAHSIFNVNVFSFSHIVILLQLSLIFIEFDDELEELHSVNQFQTTYIKSNQKLNANIV